MDTNDQPLWLAEACIFLLSAQGIQLVSPDLAHQEEGIDKFLPTYCGVAFRCVVDQSCCHVEVVL